jgi:hypothetical protein
MNKSMQYSLQNENSFFQKIAESKKTIYDPVKIGDPDFWIPTSILENLLLKGLVGLSLKGLPLRTRSKILKQAVCKTLGYPIPGSFKKTQPRFPGQSFDTYVQKSNNLQIWNEEISPTRRYVIIHLTEDDIIDKIRVITGELLASLDRTGTLTQKYQARITLSDKHCELLSPYDTDNIRRIINNDADFPQSLPQNPNQPPIVEFLFPISEVFNRIKNLIGREFIDTGRDQERNRGAILHQLVCSSLGYSEYHDGGQFPDIVNQLVEVKLQMSPTIDLGLVLPSSVEALDIPRLNNRTVRHCDVRYAIFYASLDKVKVTLTHLFLTTGEDFFNRFTQFAGKVKNTKLQIPLPRNFFD